MKLNINNILFISTIHILPIITSSYFEINQLNSILLLWAFKCIGVTAGMHRLWTHQSYNTHPLIKLVLLTSCNSTFEGSVKNWTINHKMHHRFEESNRQHLDPYSIKKGFFWAHTLCHLVEKSAEYKLEAKKVERELYNSRHVFDNLIIEFEDRCYTELALFTGIIFPTLLFKIIYYNHSIISCFYSVILSILLTYHCTWSINSFAHMIGDKPYSSKHTSCDNHLLSIFTFGEGYHNYHHSFPKDYKASHTLQSFNITGWFIFLLYKLDLAYDLREVSEIKKTELPELDNIHYEILY